MNEPQTVDGAFTATRTILSPAPMLGIPEVLLDEPHGLWSVRPQGAAHPTVFRCSDIASCKIVEEKAERQPTPEGFAGLGEVIMNPMTISRANAVRKGNHIMSVDVVVGLRQPDADPVHIRLWTRPLKIGSRSYKNVLESAEEVKRIFTEMMVEGNG